MCWAVRSGDISGLCFATGLGRSSCYLISSKSPTFGLGADYALSLSSQLKNAYRPFETLLAPTTALAGPSGLFLSDPRSPALRSMRHFSRCNPRCPLHVDDRDRGTPRD